MKLLAQHIDRQFQKNVRQHVLANEIIVKVQRIRECFTGDSLPEPIPEVTAAWNDLPNKTTHILPMSMKTELIFLPAPPPTPTGLAFDMDDAASSDPSSNGSYDDDWVFVDDTDSPTPDVLAFRAVAGSAASEDDSMSRCSYPHPSLDRQIHEEDSFQSTDSRLPSSDPESPSSPGSRDSTTPVGFYDMTNQWLLDYRARGVEPFIESLIAFGVMSPGCAQIASRIARVVVRKVAKISYMEGKSLDNALRSLALAAFKTYWDWNDTCTELSSTRANTTLPTPHGINIASFVGSLFDAGVFSARDIYLCLSLLSEGEKRFDHLCAMHALLEQANDKLCKSRNLPALMQFKDNITSRDGESGEYLWVTTSRARTILADILATIERWTVSQSLKRDQSWMLSGNRAIRRSAVGPRLRVGGHVGTEPFTVV